MQCFTCNYQTSKTNFSCLCCKFINYFAKSSYNLNVPHVSTKEISMASDKRENI